MSVPKTLVFEYMWYYMPYPDVDSQHALESYGAEEWMYTPSLNGLSVIISDTTRFPEADLADKLMIPIVTRKWITDSVERGRILPLIMYEPTDTPMHPLVGLNVCIGAVQNRTLLASALHTFGAYVSTEINSTTKHIIVDSENDPVLIEARRSDAEIVKPEWALQCLKERQITKTSKFSLKRNLTSVIESVKPAKKISVLRGKRVIISSDLELKPKLRTCIEDLVINAGGTILLEDVLDEADIVVCVWRAGDLYVKASRKNLIVGSPAWLLWMLSRNKWVNPMDRLDFYPRPCDVVPEFENKLVSVTQITGAAREYIIDLLRAMGATYRRTFSDQSSFLIAGRPAGRKYDAGSQMWRMYIVNHLYIEECYAQWRALPMSDEKFKCRKHLAVGKTRLSKENIQKYLYQSVTVDEEKDNSCESSNIAVQEVDRKNKNSQDSSSKSFLHLSSVGNPASQSSSTDSSSKSSPIAYEGKKESVISIEDDETEEKKTNNRTKISVDPNKSQVLKILENSDNIDSKAIAVDSPISVSNEIDQGELKTTDESENEVIDSDTDLVKTNIVEKENLRSFSIQSETKISTSEDGKEEEGSKIGDENLELTISPSSTAQNTKQSSSQVLNVVTSSLTRPPSSTPPQDTPTSSAPSRLTPNKDNLDSTLVETPHNTSETITPRSSNRKAKAKAAAKLHDDISDLNEFQKRKRRNDIPILPDELKRIKVVSENHMTLSHETDSSQNICNLLITGVDSSKISIKALGKQGVRIVSEPLVATHVVAPRICRTPNFLISLAHAPKFLNTKFLSASDLKLPEIPDIYTMKDTTGEQDLLGGESFLSVLERAKTLKGRLLEGFTFNIAPNVRGGIEVFNEIVQAHGANPCILLKSATRAHKVCNVSVINGTKRVILVASKDQKSFIKAVRAGFANDKDVEVHTVLADWVFTTILQMKVNFQDESLFIP